MGWRTHAAEEAEGAERGEEVTELLPDWAARFSQDFVALAAKTADAHPQGIVDLAGLIAAELRRFHAEQRPQALLAAIAGIAELSAWTDDGRLVTKPDVSPLDFMRRVAALIGAIGQDIVWRVGYTEKTSTLETALSVAQNDILSLRLRLGQLETETADLFLRVESYRHLIDKLWIEDADPQATIPERAALQLEHREAVFSDGRAGPVAALVEAVKNERVATVALETHVRDCARCSVDTQCEEGERLARGALDLDDRIEAALGALDPAMRALRR